jgi:hypothetical protein
VDIAHATINGVGRAFVDFIKNINAIVLML